MTEPLLSVIVLTKDEEANLPALLASLEGLPCRVFVVDSGSTDRTIEIARCAGCEIVEHPFENYAAQRNWAFDNLPVTTAWTLCLDADERLTPDLRVEIAGVLASDTPGFDGYMLRKQTWFMGRWLRHGGQYPSWHLRLARIGKVRCEDRLYDQHYVVDGNVRRLENDYIDILTDNLTSWTDRHNRWATLEARELLSDQDRVQIQPRWFGTPIERKRFLRMKVYRAFPLFVRPLFLFLFDYVIRLGFLDGRPGLVFHVLQRFWFRFLVDAKLWEMRLNGSRGRGTSQ
ncbi:MAG: glycosyltransferase family 2 protein [Rhodospirillales bacterium]|nr:glycosyltransferase family 2 protein [Rhodospirillales bacterium]